MLFSSLTFLLLFLPLTLALYYLVPGIGKNIVLLLASLIFYAWGEPVYIFLMLLSICANYGFGLIIGRTDRKMLHLAIGIAWNLLNLGFFKYFSLLQTTFGILPGVSVALPIGISFYTFQAISYLIDVERGTAEAQTSLLDFAMYISMFPQLIAGPIVRYSDISGSLHSRSITLKGAGRGADRFIVGLGKKVLLANACGSLYEQIGSLPQTEHTVLITWLAAVLYTFQIYFDFAGYSDMAVGLGDMLGFRFPENFDYPYLSKSVTEFWRRWHMTLGTWFREYVYIPLGGNRRGVRRQIFNILIVWMLTGFWHGASWNFLLWGLYYGILLLVDKFVLKRFLENKPVLGWILTAIATVLGFVIFANTSFSAIVETFSCLFGVSGYGLAGATAWYYLKSSLVLLIVCTAASVPVMAYFDRAIRFHLPRLTVLGRCLLLLLSVAVLVYASYNPFLYFRF